LRLLVPGAKKLRYSTEYEMLTRDINSEKRVLPCILSFGSIILSPRLSLIVTLYYNITYGTLYQSVIIGHNVQGSA
jgi:hypothetical protein